MLNKLNSHAQFLSCVSIAMLCLFSAATANAEFVYKSDAGGFTMSFPGEPKLVEDQISRPDGSGYLPFYTLSYRSINSIVVITWYGIPEEVRGNAAPFDILAGSRDGALRRTGAKLISEQTLYFQGYPALEFLSQTPRGNNLFSRVIHADDRIFNQIVQYRGASIPIFAADSIKSLSINAAY